MIDKGKWAIVLRLTRWAGGWLLAALMLQGLMPVVAKADQNLQSPAALRVPPNLRFKSLEQPKLGILGEVLAITQDTKGFMWFGGKNGLARYDGYNMRIYQHDDVNLASISTNTVNDLAADSNGDLWVATYWGLNRYDVRRDYFERFLFDENDPSSIGHNSVKRLLLTTAGELWVGTEGGGLARFNRTTGDFTRYQHHSGDAESISSNAIASLEEDGNGMLWLGMKDLGIDIFDPRRGKVIQRLRKDPLDPESLSQAHPTAIERGPNGEMWIGTYWGLNHYLGGQRFSRYLGQYDEPHALSSSNIQEVAFDAQGRLWVACGDRGLVLYNPANDDFDRFMTEEDGRRVMVSAIFSDQSGGLWFGLTPGGVAYLDRHASAFRNYTHQKGNPNSISNQEVLALAEDRDQNLWVGTRGGLNFLNRETGAVRRYVHDPNDPSSLPSQAISSILVEDDRVWVGTTWSGLGVLDLATQKFSSYVAEADDPRSLANREVWSLLKDSRGVIWVGTNDGGLMRYQPQTDDFFRYRFQAPKKNNAGRVVSITEDHRGDLWLATDDGLFQLPLAMQTLVDEPQVASTVFRYYGLGSDHTIAPLVPVFRDVYESSAQILWMAMEGGGVGRWDSSLETYREFHKSHGLLDNTVSAIVEDEAGFLWFGTGAGISRFNPADESFQSLTKLHGLPSNIFGHPVGMLTSRGEVAFGSADGLTLIDPHAIYTNSYQAPVVMTGFYLFNEPASINRPAELLHVPEQGFTLDQAPAYSRQITLDHTQSVFSLEFALLNFDLPELNQYAYQLEGFDRDWIDAGKRNQVTYTNLDPGTYRFRVKAANSEGQWQANELTIDLLLLPPWWRTWWAYVIYALCVVGVLAKAWHGQLAKRRFVEQQNRLLESRINERTQELKIKNQELQAAYKKVEQASYSDPLTGLHNRRFLYSTIIHDMAKVERSHSRRSSDGEPTDLVFFLVDIDHFKSVNDQFGHASGDALLKELAQALTQLCRDQDLVIRWGGEEFLVVCRYVSRRDAAIIAERIRQAVACAAITLESGDLLQRTCSVGYSCYPFDPENPKALSLEQTIDLADGCLYYVKHHGRNGWAGIVSPAASGYQGVPTIEMLTQAWPPEGVIVELHAS